MEKKGLSFSAYPVRAPENGVSRMEIQQRQEADYATAADPLLFA